MKTKIKKDNARDMTKGPITKELLAFALPIFIGNLFQQFYHAADGIIVGRFVSHDAFGAVSSNMPAINAVIGLMIGFASGASVVISQYFGAGNKEDLEKAVHTALASAALIGLILAAVGVMGAPFTVRAMKADELIAPYATSYLEIYYAGLPFLILYNMGMGILRAVGDSKRPLWFLIFSSAVNIALDLYFVINLRLGVEGAAYATVISEFLAALLTLFILFKSREAYGLKWKKMKIDFKMFKRITRIGLPSGLQISVTSFSNMFVQGYINAFGHIATDGWGAYMRIDSLLVLPLQALSLAMTTFTGQNFGADKKDRIRSGERLSFGMTFVIIILLISGTYVFAPQLVSIFNKNPEAAACGVYFTRAIVPFAVFRTVPMVTSGILRGTGDAKVPMAVMLTSFVAIRQIYLFISTRITESITPVTYAFPVGWAACAILLGAYYLKKRKSFTEKPA